MSHSIVMAQRSVANLLILPVLSVDDCANCVVLAEYEVSHEMVATLIVLIGGATLAKQILTWLTVVQRVEHGRLVLLDELRRVDRIREPYRLHIATLMRCTCQLVFSALIEVKWIVTRIVTVLIVHSLYLILNLLVAKDVLWEQGLEAAEHLLVRQRRVVVDLL